MRNTAITFEYDVPEIEEFRDRISHTLMKYPYIVACIAVPRSEDEYLTRNSLDFHHHMGYRIVGEFENCGYKFGKWYNMAWAEKIIGEHKDGPDKFIPVKELNCC